MPRKPPVSPLAFAFWLLLGGGFWLSLGRSPVLSIALGALLALLAGARLLRFWWKWRRLRAVRIADVDAMSGAEFEEYVGRLLEHQGYAVEVTQATGDLGVDLIAERGNDRYAVQAKRYAKPVSRRAVSDAVAGRSYYGCTAAMVVTNSYFTAGAEELAEATECELVDREALTDWILEFRSG